MKPIVCILAAICLPAVAFCQDITGLWKGTLFNDSTKQSLDYEIVITKEKGKLSGFSHTWFVINNKRYYGVKKLNVRIAGDGKIVLQDTKLVEHNYPLSPLKDVYQLNVLDLVNNANEQELRGRFVTNRTRMYNELTGDVHIKKASHYAQSDLLIYLQKNSKETFVAVAK